MASGRSCRGESTPSSRFAGEGGLCVSKGRMRASKLGATRGKIRSEKPLSTPPVPTRYPDQLLSQARKLRRDMTGAEAMLWRALRGSRVDGLKFRRQVP